MKTKKIFLSSVVIFIISSSNLITIGIDEYGYGKKDVIKLNELSEYNTFLLDTKNQNPTCKISTESPDIEITINGLSEIYLGTFDLNNLIASGNINIKNKIHWSFG